MSNLKKEIKKAIGDTETHKVNVWQKLQQPKRKNRMPLFVSAALVLLASLWLITLQFPSSNGRAGTEQDTQQTKDSQSFTSLYYEQQKPTYVSDDYAILHATNVNEYKLLAEQMKVPLNDIDFTTYDVLFTLYTSDGCGLVIDRLTESEDTLNVHLALPSDLRDEKQLNCTAVAKPHLAVIQIEKLAIQKASFKEGKKALETAFNTLDIDWMSYHFELLQDPYAIETIQIQDLINGTPITIDEEVLKKELPRLIQAASAVPGIANMANAQYEIFVKTRDSQSQKIYLWITPESDTISVMSSRDTHQIYLIPKSEADFILLFIK